MRQQMTLQEQLKSVEEKVQVLAELVMRLKADQIALMRDNADLMNQIEQQSQNTQKEILPADQEQFKAQVMQAKKIKREVEQTLRDAERKLELIRF